MNKERAYKIATDALEDRRTVPFVDLSRLAGSTEKSTIAGPDGETYFLELRIDRLTKEGGVRITATVDQGNSFKLERIEETIEIRSA